MNINVSPNGHWVSWVNAAGELHVAALTGDGRTDRVLRRSVDGQLLEPVWSADSSRLLISDLSTKRIGTINVGTGAFTALPQSLPAPGTRSGPWTARASAFLASDGSVMVARPDGTGQRQDTAKGAIPPGGLEGQRAAEPFRDRRRRRYGERQPGPGPGQSASGCRSLLSNTLIVLGDGRQIMEGPQAGSEYAFFQAVFRQSDFEHISRSLSAPIRSS